jgi:hypothetical protein
MFACLIGLASLHWTQWVNDHSVLVVRIMVGLGIGMVLCFLFWMLTDDTPKAPVNPWEHLVPGASGNYIEAPVIEDSTATNSGNFVGRDNSGPQLSTGGGSIIGDSALKELMRSLPAQPVEPPKLPEPTPSMVIGGTVGGFYWEPVSYDGNGFCFDGDGKLSLSVLIKNERAPLLQKGCKAYRVIAHLVFNDGIRETMVDRAYWIGSIENQITFEAPQTTHLLLGFNEGDRWRAYDNRNISRVFGWQGMESAELQPEDRNIIFVDHLEVEISIISLKDDQTLAERTAIIERQGDGCVARWKK